MGRSISTHVLDFDLCRISNSRSQLKLCKAKDWEQRGQNHEWIGINLFRKFSDHRLGEDEQESELIEKKQVNLRTQFATHKEVRTWPFNYLRVGGDREPCCVVVQRESRAYYG